MTINIERLRQEIRLDNRRFTLQIIATVAAAMAAGAGLLGAVLALTHVWH